MFQTPLWMLREKLISPVSGVRNSLLNSPNVTGFFVFLNGLKSSCVLMYVFSLIFFEVEGLIDSEESSSMYAVILKFQQ